MGPMGPIPDYAQARDRMVDEQIAGRGVRDSRVLDAMRKVERHRFVGEGLRHQAYEDHPLPIGSGQTISQPYIVAAMTEHLQVRKADKVLELGTGSGYQTAVLAELAAAVYTVELLPELSRVARLALADVGYRNVRFRTGDGHLGWPEFAPFDRIVVTAAAQVMPTELVRQLTEGGRIVVPVGPADSQTLFLGVRHGHRLVQRALMQVAFVPFVRGNDSGGVDS
jgi:protein-L-isoaspartate(D-aspartate) O-methyltransferase